MDRISSSYFNYLYLLHRNFYLKKIRDEEGEEAARAAEEKLVRNNEQLCNLHQMVWSRHIYKLSII